MTFAVRLNRSIWLAATMSAVWAPLAWTPRSAAQTSDTGLTAENPCSSADTAFAASQWELAHRLYTACLAAQPSNYGALSNLGVVFSRLGRMQDAVESYKKALAISAGNRQIELNLALAYVKSGSYQLAVDTLQDLQKQGDDLRYEELLAFCYYHLGFYTLAARASEKVLKVRPDDPANELILGSAYTKLGLYAKALPLITSALNAAGSAEGHLIMAQTLLGLHSYQAALDELNQIPQLNPEIPGFHSAYGVAYVGLNRVDEAKHEFKLALASDPNDYQAYYYLGRLARIDGDFAQADKYLRRADELQPNSAEVELEIASMDVAQRRYADAVPLLESVIKQNPDYAPAYLMLSKSYQRTGRKDEAQKTGEMFNKIQQQEQAKLGKNADVGSQ